MKRASAFYQLVYHFTWSTKNRAPMITPAVAARLYPYIQHKCKALGYRLHAIGGNYAGDKIHPEPEGTPPGAYRGRHSGACAGMTLPLMHPAR